MSDMELNPIDEKFNAKVLVVDDIAANRNLLRETMELKDYEVLLAPNGEAALKLAQRAIPDIILLDVNMPEMDGFEVCRRLKKTESTRNIPTIFITASDSVDSVMDGFRVGGVDYVTKPFKPQEVQMRVETHLKISRLTAALNKRNDELQRLNHDLEAEIIKRERAEQSLLLVDEDQPERFHIGGTLHQDAPSYLERQADRDLLESLLRGDFCYVLTSRQMGKSSLMVRTAKRLKDKKCSVVTLDLTALGQNVGTEQWYGGLLAKMSWELDMEDSLESFWSQHERLSHVQRLFLAIREVVLTKIQERVCIFIDELDMVRSLSFATDEFFAAIRETYNNRSEDPRLKRLSFCLLGVATPSELIEDDRMTPFNIGRRVELEDFTRVELTPLMYGLGRARDTASELMDRIYYWTNGHPYLTQKLCKFVLEDESVQTAIGVDELCAKRFLSSESREQDDNLLFVREMLVRGNKDLVQLLNVYERILKSERVEASESSAFVSALRLSGVTRVMNGSLVVRNRIYERVFDGNWIKDTLSRLK